MKYRMTIRASKLQSPAVHGLQNWLYCYRSGSWSGPLTVAVFGCGGGLVSRYVYADHASVPKLCAQLQGVVI